jgi:hypothetical protein
VDGFDFYLTHKKHSRNACSLSFVLPACDPAKAYIQAPGTRNNDVPTHPLELVNDQDKKTMDLIRQDKEIEIQPLDKVQLQDGDVIRTQHGTDSLV